MEQLEEREIQQGISSKEAEKRLEKYGKNELENKNKVSPLYIFLSQFNDLITWILIAATFISGFMGEKGDAITIIIIVIVNAFLGFIQEYKTEKSLEALKEMSAPTCKVVRDGSIKVINTEYLVPGDLVLVESGDRVPADSAIVTSSDIVLDESLLTGESLGVTKNSSSKNNLTYMGTIVLKGRAYIRVVQTGMSTEMGKIAGMLQSIEKEKSPLKERLNSLGKILVVICIAICIIVTVMGIMRGENIADMFLLGVSLAVAAIPEALTAIVTVALALGVSRMLKKNALVRKLPAVETLGCTSIICSDKTGTLTQNKMTVLKLYFDNSTYEIDNKNASKNEILKKCFIFCNDCNYDFNEQLIEKAVFGDPTETALVRAYFKNTKELRNFIGNSKRIYDLPFDSNRKMMSVIIRESNKDTCYVKGAPERILDRCKYILVGGEVKLLSSTYKESIKRAVSSMSSMALRCIAGAYKQNGFSKGKDMENDLIFIGIAGMIDPPRKEAKEAVFKCKAAGIRPVMITGDHKNTAYAIAKELQICENYDEVIAGEEIDNLNDKELSKLVKKISVFARVSPSHKLRIVKAFKANGHVVAMTGDGVNDAPAVKEADIGISMGISGTDVTKEASSMVLLDDNFATIVSAVEEGRVIYNNIRKFIRYLLSCNLGEVLTMFLASLFNLETPLLAIQILLVNLATDGLPAIALGVDPADKDIMLERPRVKNESIFARGLGWKIFIRGSLIGICTVASFMSAKYYGMSIEACRTVALSTLIMSQLIHVFECRSEKHSIFEIKILTNMYLLAAVSVSICMILCVLYIPFFQDIFHTVAMDFGQWVLVLFFSGIIAFINSVYLYFYNK